MPLPPLDILLKLGERIIRLDGAPTLKEIDIIVENVLDIAWKANLSKIPPVKIIPPIIFMKKFEPSNSCSSSMLHWVIYLVYIKKVATKIWHHSFRKFFDRSQPHPIPW